MGITDIGLFGQRRHEMRPILVYQTPFRSTYINNKVVKLFISTIYFGNGV